MSVGPRAGGLFLTISNPNTASAFGDAGFGELDLSAQWRIYSCFGRASLADLTCRVSSRARTAMPLRYRSARRARQLPHPLAGVGMGIYRTLPADGYHRDDRDVAGRGCGA